MDSAVLAAKLGFGFVLGVALCACSDMTFGVHDDRDAGFGGSSGSGGSGTKRVTTMHPAIIAAISRYIAG